MPESIPIGKSDQALASSVSGAILKSQGPAAIPTTATPGTDYSVPANPETIAGVKTHTSLIAMDYAARAGDQINSLKLVGDTANPPWQVGHSSQYSGVPERGSNFVVSLGHNVNGQANQTDPTKPTSSIVFEGDYYSDVFIPPEQSFETYLSNIWPDGTVIRPWFVNVGKVSKTAIVGLVCSRFTVAREDQAAMMNLIWDPISTNLSLSTTYPGANSGAFFSLAATPTTDSFALGRSTNTGTNMFLNAGASGQIDKYWQLNGVTKFKQSLNSASGGTFTLYDPTGVGVEAAWVSGGKSYRQSTARTMIGYVIPAAATAQFEVVPVDASTIGLFVLGASGQTANYLQVQAWAGTSFLVVDGAGRVLVGEASAGSAAAQFEAKAKDGSTTIAAFYSSDGSKISKFGPSARLTTPGRDGPIIANADAATITLDLSASDFHTVALGGNRTLAITGATTGQRFTVKLIQGGAGSWNPIWWSNITWYTADGLKPTPAATVGKSTYVQFICTGSGTYDGFLVAGQA